MPVLRVRDWLARDSTRTRSCLFACFRRWKLTRFEPEEQISRRVTKLMNALSKLSYIVEEEKRYPDESQFYKLTKLGEEFARASGAKRVKREIAAQTLEGFMARVAEVNAIPVFWSVSRGRLYMVALFAARRRLAISILLLTTSRNSRVRNEKRHSRNTSRQAEGLAAAFWICGSGLSLR